MICEKHNFDSTFCINCGVVKHDCVIFWDELNHCCDMCCDPESYKDELLKETITVKTAMIDEIIEEVEREGLERYFKENLLKMLEKLKGN